MVSMKLHEQSLTVLLQNNDEDIILNSQLKWSRYQLHPVTAWQSSICGAFAGRNVNGSSEKKFYVINDRKYRLLAKMLSCFKD